MYRDYQHGISINAVTFNTHTTVPNAASLSSAEAVDLALWHQCLYPRVCKLFCVTIFDSCGYIQFYKTFIDLFSLKYSGSVDFQPVVTSRENLIGEACVFVHMCIMQQRFMVTPSDKTRTVQVIHYQDNTNIIIIFSCFVLEKRKIMAIVWKKTM